VRVLEEQVGKLEEGRTAWEARTRAETEKQVVARQREAYHELEERLAREVEQTRATHEEIARAREAHLSQQESQVTYYRFNVLLLLFYHTSDE
jgi:hypothetical protein